MAETAAPHPPALRPPPYRRLRVFAFDPSLQLDLDTSVVNRLTLEVPWESLAPGPVGEYLEVVDLDANGQLHAAVDLDAPYLLAQDGLAPSESDPRFHQQMVYAVAMVTVATFERALGRRVLWRVPTHQGAGDERYGFVRRLKIHPHGLAEANAYYSPSRTALLFGYFAAPRVGAGNNLPGGTVYSCLSHDIVVHEVTHALLDGMHRRFTEPSNPDVLALHEAFADVVALLQHFSYPEVLRHQIARTRGDLARQNLLAQLAQQFGQATGRSGALRDALGAVDRETGVWRPRQPDPEALSNVHEPHDRGAILVAAVFDAFLVVYRRRIADLLRIATGGSGVLPPGELHPDLVARLADEAAATARHLLALAIRALDYCPPVDVTFGDYLRAMITADVDVTRDDRLGYRIALVESFRRHGIYPEGASSLSIDGLTWSPPTDEERSWLEPLLRYRPRAKRSYPYQRSLGPRLRPELRPEWSLRTDRQEMFETTKFIGWYLHEKLLAGARRDGLAGLAMTPATRPTVERDPRGEPLFEVHSVRPATRVGPAGESVSDLVIEITQRRRGYRQPRRQVLAERDGGEVPEADFTFRGGCTLLVDYETGELRHAIRKDLLDDERLARQRFFLDSSGGARQASYFRRASSGQPAEPFALLHRPPPDREG